MGRIASSFPRAHEYRNPEPAPAHDWRPRCDDRISRDTDARLQRGRDEALDTWEVLDSQKPVAIGNNVFPRWGCIVLAGTTISDNRIIGAGSVVSRHVEGNSIWGGISSKKISGLEHYYEQRKANRWRKPLRSTAVTKGASTQRRQKRCFTSTSICSLQAPTICAAHSLRNSRITETSMNASPGSVLTPNNSIPIRISATTRRNRLAAKCR